MSRKRVVIAGAAGRDFHNFNLVYRGRDDYEVVAFTATQIPNIEGRVYPAELAGSSYPAGIPIRPESDLETIVGEGIDEVVFSYSDVTHEHVMHIASRALAAGASFRLLSPRETELSSTKPVVAVCAVRTGSGKSQTTRHVAAILRAAGKRVAVLRHPMPYGDLTKQAVQRFARYEDLDAADCTIEEREEYEPHLSEGNLVFAGIDYGAILDAAEREADVILWDGGNNDTPFIRPDLHIVVVDPHRPGHELRYHPGETNLRMADVCVVNKVDSATQEGIDAVLDHIRTHNPEAKIVLAASPFHVEGDLEEIAGKRVLAVEDGPTLTHGEMTYGAAVLAAKANGAAALVDPRPFAVGSIKRTFEEYPHVGELLPAMGYGSGQVEELRETIARSDADLVLIGTPIDLRRLIELDKPAMRVTYRLQEVGEPDLADILEERGLGVSRNRETLEV
jgi:predicted GTPase